MALDLFAVVAPGQARCRQPDARGLRDLALLGMRVAFRVGGTAEQARADMDAFGGPVVHVTDPLVVACADESASKLVVNHVLVQSLVKEMISHAASRRPSVVYCEDGVTGTGLVCAALRIALGHPWDDVRAELEYFDYYVRDRAPRDFATGDDLVAARDRYLEELARLSQPSRTV